MARERVFSLVALVLVAGCIRAGFDPLHGDGAGHAGDGGGAQDGTTEPGELAATKSNDTCGNALFVDLAPLASGPLSIKLDFKDAQNDHSVPKCEQLPELVIRFQNSPGKIRVQCTGAGKLSLWLPSSGACPGSWGSWVGFSCDSSLIPVISLDPGTAYLLLCRDPASGPTTLVLELHQS